MFGRFYRETEKHIEIGTGNFQAYLYTSGTTSTPTDEKKFVAVFVRFIWGNLIYMEINIGQLIVASASMLLRREYKKHTGTILINRFEQELLF